MKALVIAPQPFFSPRGTPFSVYYRTLVASRLGVEVDLLTYGEGQDVDLPGVRIIRVPRVRILEPIKVGPSVPKLLLDVLLVIWTVALLVRGRYDFVHAHEEAVFFCSFLKPAFRFKLVYDMHSSLPQQLLNFGYTKLPILVKLFEKLEALALKRSDAVITICPDLADYVTTAIADPEKHSLIENSLFEPVRIARSGDREDRGAEEAASPVEASTSSQQKLIVYAGTLEPYQGIDLLLRAFEQVAAAEPEARLVILGGSPARVEHYDGFSRQLGLSERVSFKGSVPQEEARSWIRRAAAVVSPRISGTNTPLKIYELLASGVPMVATDVYSHRQVLDDTVCFLVEPEPAAMARGMLEALQDEGRRAAVVAAARDLYERDYSAEAYEEKMRRLLSGLCL